MSNRKSLSPKTKEEIKTECARICCMCYKLDSDLSWKHGQIAHIDRDASNNLNENLAYLCQDHHNLYDSKFSQTQSFTPNELLSYKQDLLDHINSDEYKIYGKTVNLSESSDDDINKENDIDELQNESDKFWTPLAVRIIGGIITGVFIIIFGYFFNSWLSVSNNNSKTICETGFSPKSRDSLKIIIARFIDDSIVSSTEPECIGAAIERTIKTFIEQEHLLIKPKYCSSITSPTTKSESRQILKSMKADFIIYGYGLIGNNCDSSIVSFNYTLSDTIMLGTKVPNIIEVQSNSNVREVVTPESIESDAIKMGNTSMLTFIKSLLKLKEGKFEASISLLNLLPDTLGATNSDKALILWNRGEILSSIGEHALAKIHLERSVELDRHSESAYCYLGTTHSNMRNYEFADSIYTEGIKYNPNSLYLRANRVANSLKLTNINIENSLEDINTVIAIKPNNAYYLSIKSRLLFFHLKDTIGAIDLISQAISLDSLNTRYYFDRAVMYYKSGQQDMECKDYLKAIELGTDNLNILYNTLITCPDIDTIGIATQLIQLYPTSKNYRKRAGYYMKIDSFNLAIDDLNMASELDPENEDILNDQIECFEKSGSYNEALGIALAFQNPRDSTRHQKEIKRLRRLAEIDHSK